MRTVMTIAIIVFLLLGGSFTSYHFIQTTTMSIGDQLDTVEQSLSHRNWELAKNELTTAQQSWEKSNVWWSMLIEHQEINSIDLGMKRLEKFIETENYSHSIEEVSTLKLRFKSIYESENVSIRNIF